MQPEQSQPTPVPQPSSTTPAPRDRVAEFIVPINRNGLAIAAGYVALFCIPFLVVAPVALGLGIAALAQLKKTPEKAGRGRAWFAVIYGGICTVLLLLFAIDIAIQRR